MINKEIIRAIIRKDILTVHRGCVFTLATATSKILRESPLKQYHYLPVVSDPFLQIAIKSLVQERVLVSVHTYMIKRNFL